MDAEKRGKSSADYADYTEAQRPSSTDFADCTDLLIA
jgi:hypothetical protein